MSHERVCNGLKKTPLMVKAESHVGDLSTYLLHAHTVEAMSSKAIAMDISEISNGEVIVGDLCIWKWIKKFGIPVTRFPVGFNLTREELIAAAKKSHFPEAELKRSISMGELWDDPEKSQEMLAKIHSPKAQAKRRKSVSESWVERRLKAKAKIA